MDDFDFTDKVIIEFYGNGCLNCQIMEPIMQELEQTMTAIRFYRINTDSRPDLVQKYQVTSLPTLLLLCNGKIVAKIVGVKTFKNLRNQINAVLNNA